MKKDIIPLIDEYQKNYLKDILFYNYLMFPIKNTNLIIFIKRTCYNKIEYFLYDIKEKNVYYQTNENYKLIEKEIFMIENQIKEFLDNRRKIIFLAYESKGYILSFSKEQGNFKILYSFPIKTSVNLKYYFEENIVKIIENNFCFLIITSKNYNANIKNNKTTANLNYYIYDKTNNEIINYIFSKTTSNLIGEINFNDNFILHKKYFIKIEKENDKIIIKFYSDKIQKEIIVTSKEIGFNKIHKKTIKKMYLKNNVLKIILEFSKKSMREILVNVENGQKYIKKETNIVYSKIVNNKVIEVKKENEFYKILINDNNVFTFKCVNFHSVNFISKKILAIPVLNYNIVIDIENEKVFNKCVNLIFKEKNDYVFFENYLTKKIFLFYKDSLFEFYDPNIFVINESDIKKYKDNKNIYFLINSRNNKTSILDLQKNTIERSYCLGESLFSGMEKYLKENDQERKKTNLINSLTKIDLK